jgi:hypothetical protein
MTHADTKKNFFCVLLLREKETSRVASNRNAKVEVQSLKSFIINIDRFVFILLILSTFSNSIASFKTQ